MRLPLLMKSCKPCRVQLVSITVRDAGKVLRLCDLCVCVVFQFCFSYEADGRQQERIILCTQRQNVEFEHPQQGVHVLASASALVFQLIPAANNNQRLKMVNTTFGQIEDSLHLSADSSVR